MKLYTIAEVKHQYKKDVQALNDEMSRRRAELDNEYEKKLSLVEKFKDISPEDIVAVLEMHSGVEERPTIRAEIPNAPRDPRRRGPTLVKSTPTKQKEKKLTPVGEGIVVRTRKALQTLEIGSEFTTNEIKPLIAGDTKNVSTALSQIAKSKNPLVRKTEGVHKRQCKWIRINSASKTESKSTDDKHEAEFGIMDAVRVCVEALDKGDLFTTNDIVELAELKGRSAEVNAVLQTMASKNRLRITGRIDPPKGHGGPKRIQWQCV